MTGLKISTFRERFTELFEESEKSITSLAKDLHVSNQTISAWKTGARSPKEPTVIAIADHFGVTVEWLMGFDWVKEKPRSSGHIVIPDSNMFRKLVDYLTPDEYETVMTLFDRAHKRMKESEGSE